MRRIMYVEDKRHGLDGPGRIGWVELSRSGSSYTYRGRRFLKVNGYKWNCVDEATREEMWISGPRRDGADKLYGGVVEIDDDARVEYWTVIRARPQLVACTQYRSGVGTRTSRSTRGTTCSSTSRRR